MPIRQGIAPKQPKIVGVVNITSDSFSDGGLFLDPEKALAHARQLALDGADVIELGAASSHPDAAPVPPDEEIARLTPVLAGLSSLGVVLAVDSTQREVQKFAIANEIGILNDIRGFPTIAEYRALANSRCRLVVMHSISGRHKADRVHTDPQAVYESMREFFNDRLASLTSAGIARERIIIDPGMGFFLGSNPESSLAVLARLASLRREFGFPVMVSVSRKSFLRNLMSTGNCDLQSRTLAAEIFAAQQGADYIRTHNVGALRQALATLAAISQSDSLVRL